MAVLAQCPQCKTTPEFLQVEKIDAHLGYSGKTVESAVYCCPHCHVILGIAAGESGPGNEKTG